MEEERDNGPEGWDVVFEYTDDDAVSDGVLVPLLAGGRDTRHRVTANAYGELKRHYEALGREPEDLALFVLRELLPLVPYAVREYQNGDVLKTDYDFRVRGKTGERTLWYVPNEIGGVTVMKPEDW